MMSCTPERHEWKINDEEMHPADGDTCLCGEIQFREEDRAYLSAKQIISDLRADVAEDGRNARFVAAVRAACHAVQRRIDDTGRTQSISVICANLYSDIRQSHVEIYGRPCEPTPHARMMKE